MSLIIRGLGTAIPEQTIGQADAAEIAQTFVYDNRENAGLLSMLYRMTRVRQRGSVLLEEPNGDRYRQSFYPAAATTTDRGPATALRMQRYSAHAAPLALAACRRALDEAEIGPQQITHLITVSCTGFDAPGVDVRLVKELGLPANVGRVHVGFMGCHGALNALRVAQAFAEADAAARVLVCAVELCSLHYAYGWDPEKIVANALFADGAAALVASADNSHGDAGDEWRVAASGSCLLPDSQDEMSWRIGDNGFEMTLSPRVPERIEQHLRPWLEGWLGRHNLSLRQVGSWAVHPGGPRIIQGVAKSLDLSPKSLEPSYQVLAEYGNMSSPTVLFVIDLLRRSGGPRPCVALAFGPGLVAEATLFE